MNLNVIQDTPDDEQHPPAGPDSDRTLRNGIRINIVEDSVIVAEDIRVSLETQGYSVTSISATFAEAVAQARLHRPDLVLMDIYLHRGDSGVAAAEEIRRALNIPVVFLTAYSDEHTLEKVKHSDPYGYLIKPFEARELRTTIEMALHRFRLETKLREREAWLSTTLNSIGDGIIATDNLGRVTFMNPVAVELTGWSEAEARGRALEEIFVIHTPDTGELAESPARLALRGGGGTIHLEREIYLTKRDGISFPINDSAAPIIDERGETFGVVLVFRDFTEPLAARRALQKAHDDLELRVQERTAALERANEKLKEHIHELQLAEEKIQHNAYHDSLTGLPNRLLFNDRLQNALGAAGRREEKLAVLFLDLDRFKFINDTMGHAVGDRLIQHAAERLESVLGPGDTVARQSGDAFMVILPGVSSPSEVVLACEKIIQSFALPWRLFEQNFYLTVSIGGAIYPDDGDSPLDLIRHAETAMYRAKERRGNDFQLYSPFLLERATQRLILEHRFRRALENGEFLLYYQPQANVRTGRVTGLEALVRWQDPELGLILPGQFIPMAEENGLILTLGSWVLRAACRQFREWVDRFGSDLRLAVNISPRQFQDENFIPLVRQVLAETGLPPHCLELEITESVMMEDVDRTRETFEALSELGLSIAIDDFGTGYSSLSYLKKFPIHRLKIDRSFVRDVTHNQADAAIVQAIIALAQRLDLRLIAEGVETHEQWEFFYDRDCEEIQGYFFSRPLPAADIPMLLKNPPPPPV